MKFRKHILVTLCALLALSCSDKSDKAGDINKESMNQKKAISAADILGNPDYQAISFGGYRNVDHSVEPAIDELKEDLKILSAMNIKILRTYKVHLPQATNLLQAIKELKQEDPDFEMYVMLGAWIDCKNAWTALEPDHTKESEANASQILVAVDLVNRYPDIVKVLAVGNEAMVHWAATYFVQPSVILKWGKSFTGTKKTRKTA